MKSAAANNGRGRPKKTGQHHLQKMISGPESTMQKGVARAALLGRNFSQHVMRLLEEDYARDDRMITTVAQETQEYLEFRKKHPPIKLPPK